MAATAISRKLKTLSDDLRMTQDQVGAIVGTSARTVARWSAGETTPPSLTKERLLELVYVGEQLANVLGPEDANVWIFSPNPLLNHDKPADRIREGDFRSVLALIEALADGIVV